MASNKIDLSIKNQLNHSILKQTNNLMFVINKSGSIIEINDFTAELFESTVDNMIGLCISDFISSEDDKQQFINEIESLTDTNSSYIKEMSIMLPSGRKIYMDFFTSIFTFSDHEYIVCLGIDVTDKIIMNKNLHDELSYSRLREFIIAATSKCSSLELAMQASLDLISEFTFWKIGHFFTVLNKNEHLEFISSSHWYYSSKVEINEKTKYSEFCVETNNLNTLPGSDLIGRVYQAKKPEWITNVGKNNGYSRNSAAHKCGIQTALAMPILVNKEVFAVFEFYTDDNLEANENFLESMITTSMLVGQTLERIILLIEREQLLAETHQLSQTKTLFLASMSHELRTPLHAILSMVDLTLTTNLSAEQKMNLETVKSSSLHLTSVISDILDLQKIESGNLTLSCRPFKLKHLINNILEISLNKSAEKMLKFSFSLPQNITQEFIGDEQRIKQVIINLIINAIKFTDSGEIHFQIEIKQDSPLQSTILFQVKDTGIGISNEMKEQIFDAFFQVENTYSRKFGGSGLGLFICKKLVHFMNGKIWVNSELNKGSEFYFQIPLPITEYSRPISKQIAETRLPRNKDLQIEI